MQSYALATLSPPAMGASIPIDQSIDRLRKVASVAAGALALVHNPVNTFAGMAGGLATVICLTIGAYSKQKECETQLKKRRKDGQAPASTEQSDNKDVQKLKMRIQGIEVIKVALRVVVLAGAILFAFHPLSPLKGLASIYLGFRCMTSLACLSVDAVSSLSNRYSSTSQS